MNHIYIIRFDKQYPLDSILHEPGGKAEWSSKLVHFEDKSNMLTLEHDYEFGLLDEHKDRLGEVIESFCKREGIEKDQIEVFELTNVTI